MSYILMFYYNPLNPPFLRGTWSMIISQNRYLFFTKSVVLLAEAVHYFTDVIGIYNI